LQTKPAKESSDDTNTILCKSKHEAGISQGKYSRRELDSLSRNREAQFVILGLLPFYLLALLN
jgi:hypothetical protein